MNRILSLCFFILFIYSESNGQNVESFLSDNKEHAEVILMDKVEYYLSMHKNKFVAEKKRYKESVIVTEKGLHNNTESYTSSTLLPVVEYEAYTILPNSKKGKKIKVTEISESSGSQDHVFHDDIIERKFSYSNLEPGAKKYLYYKSTFSDPAFIHGQTFLRLEPALNIALEVKCSKDIELGYLVFNDENSSLKFTKRNDGDDVIYSWKRENVQSLKYEPNSPSYLHYAPHVSLYVKNYNQNGKTIPFLGTADLLHKRYLDYVKELNIKDDESLKALTLNMVKDLTTDEDKVKAIYYWVKENIKYIAFESGYEGFIPRQAQLVYDRKFGDCKDMASIITDMCRYANIPNVSLAWIGTRDLPYDYSTLPTFATDNHMIAVYKKNDEYIFLDATDKQIKFGFPSSFIQGKEALVNTHDKKFEISRVPVIEAEKNAITRNVDLKLAGQMLEGKATIVLDGYSRSNLLSRIGDMESKKRNDYYRENFQMGNNKFILKKYTEKNIESIDAPLEIDLDFNLNNYIVTVGDETYINLFLIKPLEKSLIEKDRTHSYELDDLILYNTTISFELPSNKEVKQIPVNFKIDNDLLQFESNYDQMGNQLKLSNKCKLKKLMINKQDFDLWNTSINEIRKQYNEVIVLKNIKQ